VFDSTRTTFAKWSVWDGNRRRGPHTPAFDNAVGLPQVARDVRGPQGAMATIPALKVHIGES
jgi:hypothetical protein